MESIAMVNADSLKIVEAEPSDVPDIIALIKELAEYEKAPQEVTITSEQLLQDGFGPQPLFRVLLAKIERKVVGMAFWYFTYSTWKGKVLYLEDLVVSAQYRKQGVGKQLFEALMQLALQYDAKRMQWQVLSWNEPAIKFYEKYQADINDEWLNCKLEPSQIRKYLNFQKI